MNGKPEIRQASLFDGDDAPAEDRTLVAPEDRLRLHQLMTLEQLEKARDQAAPQAASIEW